MSGSSGGEGPRDGGQVAELYASTKQALDHLTDVSAEDDLEDLTRMLADLASNTSEILAAPLLTSWVPALQRVAGHLREAQDLIDDGEPASRVAFEVMAAADELRGLLP